MLLQAAHLHKAYTDRPVLDDVSLVLEEKEKTALIGVNGCGKSTLLKILAGMEECDGTIATGKEVRIQALPQVPVFEKETIWEEMVFQNQKNRFPLQEYELKSILTQLGFSDFDFPISQLSGGQQRKVSLAITLATDADLLLLDEPTNHLDNDMIAWLENWLIKFSGAVFMVTHDRYFLERVCSKILELDHGHLYEHKGTYQNYLEDKQIRLELENERAQKHRNLYRKELEWVRAGCQARSTKQKSRLQRFEELRRQRFDLQEQKLELSGPVARLGKKTLEWSNLAFGYEKEHPLFHDFSCKTGRHDRIGFVGPNGAGKSTFLKLLAGELKPDAGTLDIGSTVKIGFFRQDHEMEDLNMRVIDYIEESARQIQIENGTIRASAMLERFLFDKSQHYLPLSRLSGGERRRLYLLKVLMESPNVLLLDEPTNDLDLITLEILEDYLDDFPGLVLLVSHDRYFLDRVCDYLYVLQEDGTWKSCVGGYSDLLAAREEEKEVRKEEKKNRESGQKNAKSAKMARKGNSLSWQEKKELAALPQTMEDLEGEIEKLNQAMGEMQDYQVIVQLSRQRDEISQKLEEAEERWLELSEKAEQEN